jgi:HRDC domain
MAHRGTRGRGTAEQRGDCGQSRVTRGTRQRGWGRQRDAAPSTLGELARINGVGESKLAKYGESILALRAE